MQRLTFQVAGLALATHGLTLGGADLFEEYKQNIPNKWKNVISELNGWLGE